MRCFKNSLSFSTVHDEGSVPKCVVEPVQLAIFQYNQRQKSTSAHRRPLLPLGDVAMQSSNVCNPVYCCVNYETRYIKEG